MNHQEIEARIQNAVAEITPDVLDRVLSSDVHKEERLDHMTSVKKSTKLKWIVSAAAAVCAAVVVVIGSIFYVNNGLTDSMILLDVNPSIALTTNRSDKVLKAVAQNDDGQKILDGMNLKGVDINVAVNAVIGSMVKQGYLTSTNNSILVSVDNKDSAKAETLKSEIVQDISITLKNQNIDGTIYNQTLDFSQDGLKELANKYNISIGKAVFLSNLTSAYPELSFDELANMSIENIARLVKEQNLDLSKVISCDNDDSIKENIEDAIEDINESSAPSTGTASGSYITADKAKQIALGHAGLSANQVTFIKAELERDGGRVIYEVEFYTSTGEYDYEIDAISGSIVSLDHDAENYNGNKAPATSGNTNITADKAKQIALGHAGLSANQVTFIKTELDRDDGRMEYEVEFYYNSTEYDYTIDAATGQILSFDHDIENYTPPATSNGTQITAEKAKEIALGHAGLSASQVTFVRTELDRDDGRLEYEVEFRNGRTEYEYTIDASTGSILSAEKDIDD